MMLSVSFDKDNWFRNISEEYLQLHVTISKTILHSLIKMDTDFWICSSKCIF